MLKPTAVTVLSLFASAASAFAQGTEPATRAWEFRITNGSFVPTGEQRDVVKSANTTVAQLAWLVRPSVAITGSFAWAKSRDLSSADNHKLNVFTSDMGVETRGTTWFSGGAVTVQPFIGAGAGVRSYDYRKLDTEATNNLAGYGALGGTLGMGRLGIRIEARDYVSGFKPLVGGGRSVTRNDVVITAAVSLKSRAKN